MELLIQGRNFEVGERTRDYIAKKVRRLQRHLPTIDTIRVELNEEGTRSQEHRMVARVTVSVNDGAATLSGEERGVNALAAIDLLIDSLDRRLKRHKGKRYRTEQAKKSREASPRFMSPEELADRD
jgi:putative sigma-54 modulation protein